MLSHGTDFGRIDRPSNHTRFYMCLQDSYIDKILQKLKCVLQAGSAYMIFIFVYLNHLQLHYT